MGDLLLKYQLLNDGEKKQVVDFLDFVLAKKERKLIDMSDYKENILQVSIWSEEDAEAIVDAQKKLNQWQLNDRNQAALGTLR